MANAFGNDGANQNQNHDQQHRASTYEYWDTARDYVSDKMLPKTKPLGHATGYLQKKADIINNSATGEGGPNGTAAAKGRKGSVLHTVVAKQHFLIKHAQALRTHMQQHGRDTEKVNLFTQSNVLDTVHKHWIKYTEDLDRMFLEDENDDDDPDDVMNNVSRQTRATLKQWDMIVTARSNIIDVKSNATDLEELQETAAIHKLTSKKIKTKRSAGDDEQLIKTVLENDYGPILSRKNSSSSLMTSNAHTHAHGTRPSIKGSSTSESTWTNDPQVTRPKLQIYDRLASIRNKRLTSKDPKFKYSTTRYDGISMYMETQRRAQTAPTTSSRSRAYELQYGITTMNPSLSDEQQKLQLDEQIEFQRQQHSQQQRPSTSSSYSNRFSKKPLLSSWDFHSSSTYPDTARSKTTPDDKVKGGNSKEEDGGRKLKSAHVAPSERLSPWLRKYSTAAWRDKTLGFSGKVWDLAFSKYKEETLQMEFDRMARHWKEGTIKFAERSISLFHSGLVKNHILTKGNVKIVEVLNCGLSDHSGVPFLKALINTSVTVLRLVGNRLGDRSLKIISDMLLSSVDRRKNRKSVLLKSNIDNLTANVKGPNGKTTFDASNLSLERKESSSDSKSGKDDDTKTTPVAESKKKSHAAINENAMLDLQDMVAKQQLSLTSSPVVNKLVAESQDSRKYLVELDLSSNNVVGTRFQVLLEAMQVNKTVRKLKLADCGFNSRIVGSIAEMMRKNKYLKSLSLSGNHFDASSCGKKFGEGIKVNRTLDVLDLSGCNITDEAAQSIFASLSDLYESQLKELRLGNNNIGKMACYAARYSLKRNSYLEILGLESNQLGYTGVVQLFSAMASSETLKLVKMDKVNFTPQQNRSDSDFDPSSPVGEYKLNLEQPGHRSIAIQLVGVWKKQGKHVWQNATLNGKPFELSDSMGWPEHVPTNGILSVDVIPSYERIKSEDNNRSAIDDKVLEKLYFTKRIQDATPMWRAQYLKAMAMGFFYRSDQVTRIMKSLISNGETNQVAMLVGCFFHRVLDIENMNVLSNAVDADVWEEVQARMGMLGTFNPNCPNGRYVLNLSLFEHRYFCIKMQELERNEIDETLSKTGSGNQNAVCVRNIMYNGSRMDKLKLYEWPVPKTGAVQMDYSTTRRKKNLPEATDMTVVLIKHLLADMNVTQNEVLEKIYKFQSLTKSNMIISLMKSTKASHTAREEHLLKFMNEVKSSLKRRKKNSDMNTNRVRILHILKVLTSKFNVTSSQVYDIISLELLRAFIVDSIVTLFPAINDISQKNMAMLAGTLSKEEQLELGSRLGIEKYHKFAPCMWYRVDIENSLELSSMEYFTTLAYFSDQKNFYDICIGGKNIKAPEDGQLYSYLLGRTKLYREASGRPGIIIFRLDVGNHDRRLEAAETIQRWYKMNRMK